MTLVLRVILSDRLCENAVHASRASPRTGCGVGKIKYLTVRPELSRRAPIEFSHSLARSEEFFLSLEHSRFAGPATFRTTASRFRPESSLCPRSKLPPF